MAAMSDRELQQIIKRDKPGFRVVQREPPSMADADGPVSRHVDSANRVRDLPDLRKRYLGIDDATADDAGPMEAAGGDSGDEIVVLAPQTPASDPWQPGPGPKSVVVSGSERRVIAEQG